jgi:hypothetical protein
MIRILSVLSVVLFMTLAASGQSQPVPEHLTAQQLKTLTATAETRAEHERIARYYEDLALQYRAEADKHGAMLTVFQANPVMNGDKARSGTIDHCWYLVKSLKQRAAKAEAIAKQQEKLAQEAEQ